MKLLFICTHNRCRSILAEAITNHLAGNRITAASAGSAAEGCVHPLSLKYLNEQNIDTAGLISQSWDEFEYFAPDAILTMCDSAAAEICPVWFGNSVQVHWGLEDPSKETLSPKQQRMAFLNILNTLENRINQLLEYDFNNLRGGALQQTLSDIAVKFPKSQFIE